MPSASLTINPHNVNMEGEEIAPSYNKYPAQVYNLAAAVDILNNEIRGGFIPSVTDGVTYKVELGVRPPSVTGVVWLDTITLGTPISSDGSFTLDDTDVAQGHLTAAGGTQGAALTSIAAIPSGSLIVIQITAQLGGLDSVTTRVNVERP